MFSTVLHLPTKNSGLPCSPLCGKGAAEVVTLGQVLGLCLKLRIALSGACPGGRG
ncbi:hypothetical protein ACWCXX_26750 [Streptomyces sp. NPDC001732]